MWRQPGMVVAEVAWRWSFGVAALGLLTLTAIQFLKTIPVTNADLLLIRTRMPLLMADAFAHILQGSGARLLRAAAVLVPGLGALWTLASAVGRAATLKPLLGESRARFSALLGIGFLRAALTLAGFLAYLGAAILAAVISTPDSESGLAWFLAVLLLELLLIVLSWSVLNWYLSLAPLTAARDGGDTMAAVGAALGASRRSASAFAQVSTVFGIFRLVALVAVTLISLGALAQLGVRAMPFAIALVVTLTLAYCVFADFLYLARMAAYAAIIRQQDEGEVVIAPPG